MRDDSQEIDPNVMERIMGYAFHSKGNKTKEFSPADDFAIDPSPVVRSFILQQLLKRYIFSHQNVAHINHHATPHIISINFF